MRISFWLCQMLADRWRFRKPADRRSQPIGLPPSCQLLESRRLPTATVNLDGVTGVVLITGTANSDQVTVSLDNPTTLRVRVASGPEELVQQTFELSSVSRIVFDAAAGNDRFESTTPLAVPMSLSGGDGGDTLRGSLGDDTITGGLGDDCLYGGNGVDRVMESADFGFDVFQFSLNVMNGGALVEHNHLDSIEEVDLSGGVGTDSLQAANFPGRATLRGGGGSDTLIGTSNADFLEGGDGDDSILGGDGGDTLAGGTGNDTLQGQLGNDTIDGGEDADIVLGQQGNDSLVGGPGRDVLIGGTGSDVVDGGDEDDLMLGGLSKFEGNLPALVRLRDDWNGAAAYATRVATLTATSHPYFLKSLVQPTDNGSLYDDYQQDTITGGRGQDFLLIPGDSVLATADVLTDRELIESVSVSVYGTDNPGFFPANMTKPGYLATLSDPTYGAPITRITGDPGSPLTLPLNTGGTVNTYWSGFFGTRYVTDSAWNIDGSKLMVKSNDPGQPYYLMLDGHTHTPLFQMDMTGKSPNIRWSQNPSQPDVQYGFFSPSFGDDASASSLPAVVANDDKIIKYDVTNGNVLNTVTLPFNKLFSAKAAIVYVGGHEYAAMLGVTKGLTRTSSNISLFVVDLNPAVGVNPVVAQLNGIANVTGLPTGYLLDTANLWFSPNGQQVLVSYGQSDNARSWRMFDVNLVTSAISSHVMPELTADNSFQSPGDRLLGFMPVNWSHPTFALGENGSDVFVVGVSGQFNARLFPQNEVATKLGRVGSVLAFKVGDNSFRSLTDPVNENLATHVTATNTLNPGRVFVTYFNDLARGSNFEGELVSIRLDNPFGAGGTTHLAHHRTSIANQFYSGNTLPSVSPDGSQLVFSSTWGAAQSVVQTYVLNVPVAPAVTNPVPVDLIYTAPGSTVLTAIVLPNGHLQVKLGAVVQPDVDPETVRSISLTGGTAADSMNLTGLSSGLYLLLSSIVLKGGAGNDAIIGSEDFNETISGEAGNDILNGGLGGNDRLVESAVEGTTSALSLILTATRLTGGRGTDTLSNIDEAVFTGARGNDLFNTALFLGPVTLDGSDGNDVLTGGIANDLLDGGVGNDKLTGNLGNDQLLGGDGLDTVIGAGGLNYLLTDTALNGDGDDVLSSLEAASLSLAILVGGWIDVSGFAASGINTLTGGNGDDVLIGGSGRDAIRGGSGDDVLTGGLGNDSLDGGTGVLDRIEESGDVDFKLTKSALTGLGTDTIKAIETARLTSGSGHNRLDASGFSLGAVTLDGGEGNDILQGGTKNDVLIGGGGGDLLIGGGGLDTIGGNGDDDILIGGTIASTINTATALSAIMAEWTSAGDLATRQANLFNGGGLNGTSKLNKTTVLNDSSTADSLTGDDGTDWFFQYAGDIVVDFTADPLADVKTI